MTVEGAKRIIELQTENALLREQIAIRSRHNEDATDDNDSDVSNGAATHYREIRTPDPRGGCRCLTY